MQHVRPAQLILRCYAYRRSDKSWYTFCLDLNLDAEAPSLKEAQHSLENAVLGYLETVLEGEKATWPSLIHRSAPLRHWALYYLIKIFSHVKRGINSAIAFKEPIPIHLAPCA